MKLMDKNKEKFASKKVEIKVGTRVRVDEEKALECFAFDLAGMDWGTVVEIDEEVDGYLVKPDNCTITNDLLVGWVSKYDITEVVVNL